MKIGSHSTSATPAQLFLQLWSDAEAMTSHQRLTASINDIDFDQNIATALQQNSAQAASDVITDLLAIARKKTLPSEGNGGILAVMHAIDDLFYLIHPRAQFAPSSAKRRPKLPNWLRELRDGRFISGDYGQDDRFRLIPRGPLVRLPRDENASNAESLADRFTALSVVPHTLMLATRPILTRHIVVGLDAARGVAAGRNPGAEEIVFIPVAEQSSDLVISEREISQQWFADYALDPNQNAADIIVAALRQAGSADIAFAPELVVSEAHADLLASGLRSLPDLPRLIVAGSGQTRELSVDGQRWNEARILNRWGGDLWRQRKIWPAGLGAARAAQYGLSDPSPNLHMEDTAEGDTIVIADIDGMGRCVVLICQDVEASSLAESLILHFQPDWIFVPVLDAGVETGRWAHQRAFSLSGISNARFIVVSSTALAARMTPPLTVACGLAIGPKAASLDHTDTGRTVAEVSAIAGSVPGYVKLTWRSSVEWMQTTLTATKPKR
jgi:hypothetical protein